MAAPNIQDLATSLVVTAPSPAISGTSLVVTTAEGAYFPAVPFDAILHPADQLPTRSNAERVLVTALSTDTLTITRGQGVTTAKTVAAGWRISAAVFKEHIQNAYLFERSTYNSENFAQPVLNTDGLVIGQDLHSSVTAAFANASAFFNGDRTATDGGTNYFVQLAYGSTGFNFGSIFAGGHARGTNAVPTALVSGDSLFSTIGAGFDGTSWAINGVNHLLTGLWQNASSTPASSLIEKKTFIGGWLTPMISFDSSDNSIKINESLLNAATTIYYDLGTALAVNGANGNITSGTLSATTANTLANIDTVQTFTNKRVNPRIDTTASSATPTPTGDISDEYTVTALAANATFAAPTGTPVNGQKLILRIKDNGTSRTLAWNAIYRAVGVSLPALTVINKTLYLGFLYNSADTKWDCVAVQQEA